MQLFMAITQMLLKSPIKFLVSFFILSFLTSQSFAQAGDFSADCGRTTNENEVSIRNNNGFVYEM